MKLLLPREHGAYGQLLLPLCTALVLGGRPQSVSYLLCATALALFWAHEPLLIVLGQRGTRARREHGRWAGVLLLLLLVVAAVSLLAAYQRLPVPLRIHLAMPLGLGGLVLPWLFARKEKTTVAELLVATALSSWAAPILLSKGVSTSQAYQLVWSFAMLFAVAVLLVRGLMNKLSLGWSVGVAGTGLLATHWAVLHGLLPPQAMWPLLPMAVLVTGLVLVHPSPRYLRHVGWSIVVVTLAMIAIVSLGL
mgnify:FL=1